jgi:hypothetical protein
MRAIIGTISAALASILSIYIVLVIFNIAPEISIAIFNESFIKFIAQLTVFLYLLAAWAFWHL